MSLSDLHKLKDKLSSLENSLSDQMVKLAAKEKIWEKIEKTYDNDYLKKQRKVSLNVGGTDFCISEFSINQHEETLFNEIVAQLDLSEPVFIDRSPEHFHLILEYIRNKTINLKKLKQRDLYLLRMEAEYYEIWTLLDTIDNKCADLEFKSFNFTGPYLYLNNVVGTNKVSDLTSKSLSTGICSAVPGKIEIEFNRSALFDSIEVGGFAGSKIGWSCTNGTGALIYSSIDKKNWKKIGTLKLEDNVISRIELESKGEGKYLKFESSTFLGLGYLSINEIDD